MPDHPPPTSSPPAPTPDPQPYKQGYSNATLTTHLARTAATEASFLLPHITPTAHILDIGCGPGTITRALAAHAPHGRTTGIDISPTVLDLARSHLDPAADANISFVQADVLARLPFPDGRFDVVFASHVFGHFRPPALPCRALEEARRVLKPGGVLATRDAVAQLFFPRECGLDRLWAGNQYRVLMHGGSDVQPKAETETEMPTSADLTGAQMPALLRQAGFARIEVGAATSVVTGREGRERLAARARKQLDPEGGDEFRLGWLGAGITAEEIEETREAAGRWVDMEGGWFVAVQGEMLAWK